MVVRNKYQKDVSSFMSSANVDAGAKGMEGAIRRANSTAKELERIVRRPYGALSSDTDIERVRGKFYSLYRDVHSIADSVTLLRKDNPSETWGRAKIGTMLRNVESLRRSVSASARFSSVSCEYMKNIGTDVERFGSDYLDFAPTLVKMGIAVLISEVAVDVAAGYLLKLIPQYYWYVPWQLGQALGIVGAVVFVAGGLPEGFDKAFRWVDAIYAKFRRWHGNH